MKWLYSLIHSKCIETEERLTATVDALHIGKFDMQREIATKAQEIKDLKEKLNPMPPPLPDGLYKTSDVYKGQRLYFTKNKRYYYTFKDAQDYFVSSDELVHRELQRIKATGTHFERFKKIVQWISTKYSYEFDTYKFGEVENWENVDSMLITKQADCETANILAVKLCRLAGIPANKIFVCVGLYHNSELNKEFGHAWSIYQDTKGVWWVGDATHGMLTIRPWEDVATTYIGGWSVFNDVFSCKIKNAKTLL